MKKILLLASCLALTLLTGCPDPQPKTRVVHHYYHDSGSVSTPTNEGSDNFHAVTKPDTYSQ